MSDDEHDNRPRKDQILLRKGRIPLIWVDDDNKLHYHRGVPWWFAYGVYYERSLRYCIVGLGILLTYSVARLFF